MPAAGRFRANDRNVFGNLSANDRRGKRQAAALPELPAAYSPTLKRSMTLPMNSPISRGLQLKSHGSLFKGGTGLGAAPPDQPGMPNKGVAMRSPEPVMVAVRTLFWRA
jgi:hypothetical protein